jgi:hypothetical protein
MRTAMLVTVAAGAAIGLGACSADDGGDDRPAGTAGTSAEETSGSLRGDALLIETRITDARRHTGEVLDGSRIGESPFCPGGAANGSSEGATITTTFSCPGGTLTVQYAPTQRALVQSSEWRVVSGTGEFEGLRGGGFMVASFETDDPDVGRELFAGTVTG